MPDSSPMAATATERDDVQPVANERLDRFLTGAITVLPILCLGLVGWQLWARLLGWSDHSSATPSRPETGSAHCSARST